MNNEYEYEYCYVAWSRVMTEEEGFVSVYECLYERDGKSERGRQEGEERDKVGKRQRRRWANDRIMVRNLQNLSLALALSLSLPLSHTHTHTIICIYNTF